MLNSPRQTQQQNQPTDSASKSLVITAPSISLPKDGGAIRGIGEKFAANPVTGTGPMTVPIATSHSGLGVGSSNSVGAYSLLAIARTTDNGLSHYRYAEDSDIYILSGAEDLVPVL